jgi:hypothetical protein
MLKKTTIFLIAILVFSLFPFQAGAATCDLQSASWSKPRVQVGEQVAITIRGQDCGGWGVAVKIWEEDVGPDDLTGFNVTLNFPTNSNTLNTSWVAENGYDLTGDNKFYIEATAGSETIHSYSGGAANPYLLVATGGASPTPTPTGSTPPGGGGNQGFSFSIDNPLKGGADDVGGLVRVIAQWLFNLAIPIAVIMIIYAGVLFLTAQGNPTQVSKAKDVLKWAVVGLAIILIGSGFVTLIQSILDLGSTSPGPGQTTSPSGSTQPPSAGAVGNKCSRDRDCISGLKCKNSICQRQNGNNVGEPCNGGTNCASGLACDQTNAASVIIDGQRLGICFQP